MADNRLENFLIITFLFVLVIFSNDAQSTIGADVKLDSRTSCEAVCQSTYFDSADSGYCKRGCRLFSVIDMMDITSSLEEIQNGCVSSCKDAYGDLDNACKFGCQHQQPSAAFRRKKMLSYFNEQMEFLNTAVQMHSYYSRMMDCLFDQVNHQVSYGWISFSASSSDGSGRIIIIRGSPIMQGAPFIAEGRSDTSDSKTLNYMETNLLAVDNSATPDIKNSQVGANMINAEYLFDDERRRPDVDLLTCLSLKTGMSKTTILFLFGVVIFATVWYCVASVVSSNKPKNITLPTEKLNIYGDMEYLCPLDEKPFHVDQSAKCAPPLPIKVKIQEI